MLHRVKHAFTVFLVSSVLLLILPSAFTIYLQSQVYKSSAERCISDTLSDIRRSGAVLAEQLENMDNAARGLVFNTGMLNMLNIKELSEGDPRVSQIVHFSKTLDEKLSGTATSALGYRMYIRDNEYVFYNGAVSHGLRFHYDQCFYYAHMTYEQWYDAVFGQQRRHLLPMDEITNQNGFRQSAITYIYPIIRKLPDDAYKMAVVQFFIAREQIAELFEDLPQEGCVTLLDGAGTELARIGSDVLPPVNATLMNKIFGSFVTGGSVMTIYARIDPDITLAVSLPTAVALKDADNIRRTSSIALICYALLEGLACVVIARKNAKPITRFAQGMSRLVDGQDELIKTGEYGYLEKGMNHIIESKRAECNARSEKLQIEQTLFLNRFLNDEFKGTQNILDHARTLLLDLSARYVCAAVFLARESAVLNVPPDTFGSLRVMPHPYRDGSIVVLLFGNCNKSSEMREIALRYINAAVRSLGADTRAGLGRIYDSIDDLPLSAQQALYCVQAEGLGDGVQAFDIVSRTFNAPHFTIRQQQRLANAAKHHNTNVINDIFEQILEENTKERHLSSALKSVLLATIEATLLSVAEETMTDQNISDLLHSVRRGDDMRQRLETLRQAFLELSSADEDTPTARNAELRQQMEDYVAKNYDHTELGVSLASEAFGLSESYFSITFKELLGEPFSAYLETMRLNKAIEMIRQTDETLETIALKVGYSNSTTFRRAFKRFMGISPQQYRDDARV